MSDLRLKPVARSRPSVRLQTIGPLEFPPRRSRVARRAAREGAPRTCTPSGNVANVARTSTLTRGTMHPGTTYLVVGLAALAGACASQSDTIPPTYVSPSTYENLTCRQLGEEVKRVTRAEAASTQAGKPADAADVGLFKGTMEALEQVSIEKGCNIQFQHG